MWIDVYILLYLLQFGTVIIAEDEDCNDPLSVSSSKSNLTSSSSRFPDDTYGPHQGKLYHAHAWCAKQSTADQYLEIDLGLVMMIKSIAIQGNPKAEEFVKSFSLSYSVNKDQWLIYEESNGTKRLFKGSLNQELISTNSLARITAAQYVRITPQTWHGHVCMRVELYGCDVDPFNPLGMASGVIPNSSITASTQYSSVLFIPQRGRLHRTEHGKYQCWAVLTNSNDQNQWLQIDLSRMQFVSGVATQGRHEWAERVMSYWLSHSNDSVTWNAYQNKMEFAGNTDSESVVRHVISPVMWTRFVRFRPLTWYVWISMRVEVYSYGRASPADLGIDYEKKEITDNQITASSYYDDRHAPFHGRLNFPFDTLAWCAGKLKLQNQWLQFDFGHVILVTGIVTQGRGNSGNRWLMKYQISYSLNNTSWTFYKENLTSPAKNFKGNKDDVGYVTRRFNRDVTARYVRIHEVEKHNNYEACFRATVLGRRNGPLGAPVFTNQDSSSNIVAYQHEDITLDCEAVGDWPMTFTWSYKDHVIQSTNDSKLVLQNVTKDKDQGFYTCNATNKLATNLKTLHLEVKDSIEICQKHSILPGDSYLTSIITTNLDTTFTNINENTWYAFKGNDGYYRMPTKRVPEKRCGVEMTGFLPRSLPAVSEGIVTKEVCFQGDGKRCRHSVEILVRNCNTYYVYKLKKLDLAWRAGYCVEKYANGNPAKMFLSKPSFALYNHVIHRLFDVNEGTICMKYCTIDPSCKTYNYNPTTLTCELNAATADGGFSSDLRGRSGFEYYEEVALLDYAVHDEI